MFYRRDKTLGGFVSLLFLLIFLVIPNVTHAQLTQCDAIFPDGLQTNKTNGHINFGSRSRLYNSPDNLLTTSYIQQTSSQWWRWRFSGKTCGTVACQADGGVTPQLSFDFPANPSSQDKTFYYNNNNELGESGNNQFDEVTVKNFAHLRFSDNFNEYHIKKLKLGRGSIIHLKPGDYWIDRLIAGSYNQFRVVGEGTARLYFDRSVYFPSGSLINRDYFYQTEPSKLFVYSNDKIIFKPASRAAGVFYAKDDIRVSPYAFIQGALNGEKITMDSRAYARYEPNIHDLTDFTGICVGGAIEDQDGDGIPDDQDDDRDGDGVDNDVDAFPDDPTENSDLDGDGIGDNADTDRDGDGFDNDIETSYNTDPNDPQSTPPDLDGDKIPDDVDADRDGDGVDNDQDAFPDDATETSDLDGDGIGDNADTDRDGDGFANDLEAQYSTDPNDPQSTPPDLDGDKIPDDVDDDRDGDGVDNDDDVFPDDPAESSDLDGDGTGDNADTDRDGDGISNDYETQAGTDPNDPADTPTDFDGDGIPDVIDDDADNDGVLNINDAFPFNPNESSDLDGDGVGDNSDTDRDGDGFANDLEAQYGTDPNDPGSTPPDLDGDKIPDDVDDDRDGDGVNNDSDAFPDDANESSDLDGDGIGDNADTDRDGDGFDNDLEAQYGTDPNDANSTPPDLDGDKIPDDVDDDRDGDGVNNDNDAFPDDASESSDIDGDGIGDNADADRDGDGISNDYEDQAGTDPNDPADTPPDQDTDGIPDVLDDDRDGDGVNNDSDAFPDDATETNDLDGDGIGDNSDADRDGDGFDNDVETDRNTDPNDPADYPDDVAPQLTVTTSPSQTLEALNMTVAGTVIDPIQPHSGLDSLYITSNHYADVNFAGIVNSDTGAFSIEVPLKLKLNALTVVAQDLSGNVSQQQITVTRISPPRLQNITPASGSVITDETVTIAGEVHTYLPVDELQLRVNDSQLSPISTGVDGVYRYELLNVPLGYGNNLFNHSITSADGTDAQQISLNYTPEGAENIPPPSIEVLSPVEGGLLNQDSFRLSAQIESSAGPLTVKFNDTTLLEPTDTTTIFNLNELVAFENGQDELTVTIEAIDSLDKLTTLSATFKRDNTAPVVLLNNVLDVSPAINGITTSPYLISGSVSDENLTSLLINDQSISLQPSATANTYNFVASLQISPGATLPVIIQAFDRSGNQTQTEYLLNNTVTASISALLPENNAEFIGNIDQGGSAQPIQVQVVARVDEVTGDETVVAYLEGSNSPVTLTSNGDLASGTIDIPGDTQAHTIVYELQDAQGNTITQDSINVSVVNSADVPLQLTRIEPTNNAQYIEPNAPIEVYFNREIDVSQLQLVVNETLHGKTWINNDPLGTDFIRAKGYQLENVNRDFEPVTGQITPIPGNTAVSFTPDRYYGFNADIYLEVVYNGEQLDRTTFKVRELPTFINGIVVDQFGQPLAGIAVSLPELDRTTSTNGDGGYAFGYQETGEQLIPGGQYQLLINDGFGNPQFGTVNTKISVQQNHLNNVTRQTLQELNRDIPFYNIATGQVSQLAKGDLTLDLSDARVLFNNGRTNGAVHAQFLPFEHLGVQSWQSALPHWGFGLQPKGIAVEGDAEISFKIPELRGSYDYFDPEVYPYVVILGYNPDGQVLEPIGVGQVENLSVNSVGELHLSSLDYLAYALVSSTLNDTLIDYANGLISLPQLKAALQSSINTTTTN